MGYSNTLENNARISPKYRAAAWRQLDLTRSDSPD
jgi:hypothetical protein